MQAQRPPSGSCFRLVDPKNPATAGMQDSRVDEFIDLASTREFWIELNERVWPQQSGANGIVYFLPDPSVADLNESAHEPFVVLNEPVSKFKDLHEHLRECEDGQRDYSIPTLRRPCILMVHFSLLAQAEWSHHRTVTFASRTSRNVICDMSLCSMCSCPRVLRVVQTALRFALLQSLWCLSWISPAAL